MMSKSGLQVSSLLTHEDSILWGASVTERLCSRPQMARARISNPPVSGGQCHLIHLTILSLAYMCTKVA